MILKTRASTACYEFQGGQAASLGFSAVVEWRVREAGIVECVGSREWWIRGTATFDSADGERCADAAMLVAMKCPG